MKFKVRFTSSQLTISMEGRALGLKELGRLHENLRGVPDNFETFVDWVRPRIEGVHVGATTINIESLDEANWINGVAPGRPFDNSDFMVVFVPPESLNQYVYARFVSSPYNEIAWTVNERRILDDWKKCGCPYEWDPRKETQDE